MNKAQEYNSFMQHKNHSYNHKIHSSIFNQKATFNHYEVTKQKKRFTEYNRLHKSQSNKRNQIFEMFFI